jgi:hypothetical protein
VCGNITPNAKYREELFLNMSKKKIYTAEEQKKLVKLATDNVKLLEKENATAKQLEKVISNLDEITALVDSILARRETK